MEKQKFDSVLFPFEHFAKFESQIYKKDEIIFCTEKVRGGVQYCCHLNYCNKGPYYYWMLIFYNDG